MKKFNRMIAHTFLVCTGFTYSNMARLFLRLFVGVMFMQFGIRHLVHFTQMSHTFPAVLGLTPETSLIIMITIEIVCSLFIMVGFLTRLSIIPPILTMIFAEHYILHDLLGYTSAYGIDSTEPGYLPIMFIGIYLFLMLAGPGKISLDYFISIFIISREGKNENDELEEV